MNAYYYLGMVVQDGKVLERNWEGKTIAVSKKKALSNLCYQYKKQNNMPENARIELPDDLQNVGMI